jgi:23S rRNA pseudouridine1911/1915/1917 synthase
MHVPKLTAEPIELTVDEAFAGRRLDSYLAGQFPQYSRNLLKKVLDAGGVTIDGLVAKPAYKVRPGMRVRIALPDLPKEGPRPEQIPLDILYEDEDLVAINKPARMVVHPARGHWSGTLTAALAFHFQQLSSVGGPTRPGVVHRLDRETSGVILIAKNDLTHFSLTSQFAKRTIEKEYFAVVAGRPDHDRDVIDAPIGVHPYQREKMAIRARHPTSREARTFYEVVERFRGFAALRVVPYTGRTHQIRLHLCHIGCPVLCDRLYGGRGRLTVGEIAGTDDSSVLLERHALHAQRLKFIHPTTNQPIEIRAPIPDDIERVLSVLRNSRRISP